MALSAHDVAREIRYRIPNVGAMKVHKLLYMCQGYYGAWTGEPLFDETIEAWENGPVVAELWHAEKRHETPPPGELDDRALATVGFVLARYGALSGRDLSLLTHEQDPWKSAYVEGENVVIPADNLAKYFYADEDVADLWTEAQRITSSFTPADVARLMDAAAPTDNDETDYLLELLARTS